MVKKNKHNSKHYKVKGYRLSEETIELIEEAKEESGSKSFNKLFNKVFKKK